MRALLLCCLVSIFGSLKAQNYIVSYSGQTQIPDWSFVEIPLFVNSIPGTFINTTTCSATESLPGLNIPAMLGYNVRISSMSFTIVHPNASHIDIILISPNGIEYDISSDNGGTSGFHTPPSPLNFNHTSNINVSTWTGGPPAGPYKWEDPTLNMTTTPTCNYNNGTLIQPEGALVNGTWKVKIVDDTQFSAGTLYAISITFTSIPPTTFDPFICCSYGKNVGINTMHPSKAKLEVSGVAGAGATSAAFGTDGSGISIQRNWPTIGFNQYRDVITPGSQGKYMSNGYASIYYMDPGSGTAALDLFPYGIANSFTPIANRALTIFNNGSSGLQGDALSNCGLIVNRKSYNTFGTAAIMGTTHNSHFCWGANEDTYIRGGLNGSKLFMRSWTSNPSAGNLFFSNNAFGYWAGGTNYNPLLAAEIWGGVSLSNVTRLTSYYAMGDATSYRIVPTVQGNSNEVYVFDGEVDGQLIHIEAEGDYTLHLTDGFPPNPPLGPFYQNSFYFGQVTLTDGESITMIWNASRGKWMPVHRVDY